MLKFINIDLICPHYEGPRTAWKEFYMIEQGIRFLVVGMSAVFIFLTLLVIFMRLTDKGIRWFNGHFPEQEKELSTNIQRVMGQNDDIAVAIAAVKAYMKK